MHTALQLACVLAFTAAAVAAPSASVCCESGRWNRIEDVVRLYGGGPDYEGHNWRINVTANYADAAPSLRSETKDGPYKTLVINGKDKMLFKVDKAGNCEIVHNVVLNKCMPSTARIIGKRLLGNALNLNEWHYVTPNHESYAWLMTDKCVMASNSAFTHELSYEVNVFNHTDDKHDAKFYDPPTECMSRSAVVTTHADAIMELKTHLDMLAPFGATIGPM